MVDGVGVSFYPLYISYQIYLLKSLPLRWRVVLDPLLMNWGKKGWDYSAEWLNQLIITYDSDLIVNRGFMLLLAALCLAILYVRFTISERPGKVEKVSVLNLSTAAEGVYYDLDSFQETRGHQFERPDSPKGEVLRVIPLPEVARANEGVRANVNKLIAALGVEFRLLLSERSLVVIMPLAILLSTLDVAFWSLAPEPSFSAAYGGTPAKSLPLLSLGVL